MILLACRSPTIRRFTAASYRVQPDFSFHHAAVVAIDRWWELKWIQIKKLWLKHFHLCQSKNHASFEVRAEQSSAETDKLFSDYVIMIKA